MMSTLVLVVVYLSLFMVSFLLWAVFLRLGLRWAKVEGTTAPRVIHVTAVVFAVQLLASIPSGFLAWSAAPRIVLAALVQLAAAVIVPWLMIASVFKARLLRSLQAWIPTLVSPAATAILVLFVVQPVLMEEFFVPTNAMAPTLLGNHMRGTCPECGCPSFATPPPPSMRDRSADRGLMICENFHVSQGTLAGRVFSGDRCLVAKYLAPRRWDLLVFRSPRDPSTVYVKRLVGLPGEEIRIEDGAVGADGRRLTPPASIQGITYLSDFGMHRGAWGSVDRPARLAPDEYFVLGDFSAQSEDSRFWTQGAPGHNPFAVPQSHVCGVVTHICWPPQRWRILR